MKLFTNFCGYFVLLVSSVLGLFCFIDGLDNFFDYLKCDEKILRDIYLASAGTSMLAMFIILSIGFAVSAIIYLLRHIAYKDEK